MKKETKDRIIRAIITLPIVIGVTWYLFTHVYIYPKVELWRDGSRSHTTLIEVKDGYEFAEDPYYIENTENGYNIIIKLTEKNK